VLCEKYLGLFTVLAMVYGGYAFACFSINTLGVFKSERLDNSNYNVSGDTVYTYNLLWRLFWGNRDGILSRGKI
jgi:hypothetical protein